jgi:LCP family protein required for cell wall assembly
VPAGPQRARPAAKPKGRDRPPVTTKRGKRRRFLPHRPKLRRLLLLLPLLLPLLLLAVAVGGFLYARSVYDRVEKIELADVLSQGGEGTNYLIVGSDSRNVEDIVEAGLNPDAFGNDAGGQRSDTMLVLRFGDGKAKMMSIPRDLYVPIAETGGSAKINAAYNGGPKRLILTIQESLGIPIHHYLEVDFVSFAKLVDSLGGITLDFPHPAFDTHSGLDVQQTGPVELNGPQALAYVRSRNYTEVIDGRNVLEPTADLGRVQRQQRFLSAVFGKLGDSKNPFTLLRAAGSTAHGLRVDDTLGLTEAARLAWRLRSLDAEPVLIPTEGGRNRAGSVLFLVQPQATEAFDQMR